MSLVGPTPYISMSPQRHLDHSLSGTRHLTLGVIAFTSQHWLARPLPVCPQRRGSHKCNLTVSRLKWKKPSLKSLFLNMVKSLHVSNISVSLILHKLQDEKKILSTLELAQSGPRHISLFPWCPSSQHAPMSPDKTSHLNLWHKPSLLYPSLPLLF